MEGKNQERRLGCGGRPCAGHPVLAEPDGREGALCPADSALTRLDVGLREAWIRKARRSVWF